MAWRILGTFFDGFSYLVIPPVYLSTLVRLINAMEKKDYANALVSEVLSNANLSVQIYGISADKLTTKRQLQLRF